MVLPTSSPPPAVVSGATGEVVATRIAPPEFALLVTNSNGRHVSFVDPRAGVTARVEVGAAPFGLALGPDRRAYVATAEGIAVVDVGGRRLVALVPYRADVRSPCFGEYRPGGMGIAVSPDGRHVYVGVHLASGAGQFEVMDAERLTIEWIAPVGVRPFDVLVSHDGSEAYSIDHDSYSVTVVDTKDRSARTLPVAPLGRAAFDKPHYGIVQPDGPILLPFQGRSLAKLDPRTGTIRSTPLTASTHQHGLAATADFRRLAIVGTGPAGGAAGGPSLMAVDLDHGREEILPLARPHESVALSPDGRRAFLTGGYLFADGGWDGITVVDLQTRSVGEIAVPDRPLDVAVLRP
ncbi:MAG: hypothetical protein HY329_00700 [Chloroflexi bacterium]|nr:hypothetical protein [Chloroflexota bacterium]